MKWSEPETRTLIKDKALIMGQNQPRAVMERWTGRGKGGKQREEKQPTRTANTAKKKRFVTAVHDSHVL